MNTSKIADIVNAVLYEGYILYPYRPSSKKNARERFTFGRVYPQAYSEAQRQAEPCMIQTECLVKSAGQEAAIEVAVKFLQPMSREVRIAGAAEEHPGPQAAFEPGFRVVPELQVDGVLYQSWLEAVEREINCPALKLCEFSTQTGEIPFRFPGTRSIESLQNQQRETVGWLVRRQESIEGMVEVTVRRLEAGLCKVTVRVKNHTPLTALELVDRDQVAMRTLGSTHTLLGVSDGEWISLLDPPATLKAVAADCRNIGTWPVLVGDETSAACDTMLSSPIILYDFPKVAPESAGTLFDGTEIDEILSLRILTLTDAEKLEMRRVDEQARRLLERTESLPEGAWAKLHGTMREPPSLADPAEAPTPVPETAIDFDDFFGASTRLKGVSVKGVFLKAGDRVRLRPKSRADAFDLVLDGQTAVIEAVEQDLERRVHLAVILEHDPGKDLGLLRQPGHRFFYGVEEVEPLTDGFEGSPASVP